MSLEKSNPKIRLNKYLAHAGLGNRRSCEILIKNNLVSVNGIIVSDPSFKVNLEDEIIYKNEIIKPEKKVYILINKPKDFVFDSMNENDLTLSYLIRTFPDKLNLGYQPKVFPIVTLAKNDTGLMLISNDKELQDIYNTTSSYKKVVFTLTLEKPLLEQDFSKLKNLNEIHYLSETKDNISVEFKFKYLNALNKMFSDLGIKILKKDCIIYDFLNKKNLPRGKWRFLNASEVVKIKHLKY